MSTHACGIYRATVYDIADPESRGRIRVRLPLKLGTEVSDWAEPCFVPNWRSGVLKGHSNHNFTDVNDGDASSGPVAQSLAHNHNHELITLTPAVGSQVWVMFQGGDIDYPVWMGTP